MESSGQADFKTVPNWPRFVGVIEQNKILNSFCYYYCIINKKILASCGDFGSSGSGVVREWRQYDVGPGVDTGNPADDPQYQYSFVGPLSMSKGCDLTMEFVPTLPELPEFVYRGERNPTLS